MRPCHVSKSNWFKLHNSRCSSRIFKSMSWKWKLLDFSCSNDHVKYTKKITLFISDSKKVLIERVPSASLVLAMNKM